MNMPALVFEQRVYFFQVFLQITTFMIDHVF